MNSTTDTFPEFLRSFAATIDEASQQLLAISDSDAAVRPNGDDDWSQKEILGHLIDSAANNHQRFVRAQFSPDLVFPGYQQNDWVAAQAYNKEDWTALVNLWAHYNRHMVHLVSAIPETELTKWRQRHNLDELAFKAVSPDEPTTLEYFIRDYVVHMRHHLDQIFSTSQTSASN